MKLDAQNTAFGRHETFPLRYAWLTKGFGAAMDEPDIFRRPDDAMVRLGVGRNMVNAILYWLQAACLVTCDDGEATPTAIGEAILGTAGDTYLEDQATLWILHWLIASNAARATGFFWFFNRFSMPRFTDAELLSGLTDFVRNELKLERSNSTLKSDVSTLLRMYAPAVDPTDKRSRKLVEDHLDTLMSQLALVEKPGKLREYRSLRVSRPFLPPIALHLALANRFGDGAESAIPVRELLYAEGTNAAPGAVFRLSEEGLMAALNAVLLGWPGQYELRDTAGIHQLYRIGDAIAPADILRGYYSRLAA